MRWSRQVFSVSGGSESDGLAEEKTEQSKKSSRPREADEERGSAREKLNSSKLREPRTEEKEEKSEIRDWPFRE